MSKARKEIIQRPKQAVNQFFHYKKSSSPPKKKSGQNSQDDVEIVSTKYPKEGDMIIVREQDKKSLDIKLCVINHLSDSVVFDSLIRNKKNVPVNSTAIGPGQSIYYQTKVEFHGLDHVHSYLYFGFHNENTGSGFTKKIVISTQLKNHELEVIKPTSAYKHLPGTLLQKGEAPTIIYPAPAIELSQINKLPKVKVGQYSIPNEVRKIINHGLKDDGHLTKKEVLKFKEIKNVLMSKLTKDNYREYFKLLLYIEELQNEIEIGKFNIPKTPMYCQRNVEQGIYLELEVSAIIDCNIKLFKYGGLSVRIIEEDGLLSEEEYRGIIELIKTSSILILFGKELANIYYDDMEFHVQFSPSRHTVRLQHRALDLVKKYNFWPILFPVSGNIGQLGTNPQKIEKYFDENISKNPEQQAAVSNIVSGVSRPCPYIIFGPPGTGKTVTIIEAMKQVVSLFPESHVLACAFSNAAADILALKLLDCEPEIKILRMYALYFEPNKIPEKIYFSSNYSEKDDTYFYPSLEELKTYNIIICTVTTAGRMTSEDVLGHFTHIFIDESGFCMEPELIVAIAGSLDLSKTQLVLTGDPKQLGPVIRSPFATECKLNVSLLERIMTTNQIYERQSDQRFNQKVITKLLKNYRSHPTILKVVNDLFYDKELQASADMAKVSKFCKWDGLPKIGFPLFVHSVVGKEQREGNSPSYFNSEEASIVLSYVQKLYQSGVSPEEIGVITPYCKQVQKINILLQKQKIKNVKVNSVEKYLGDERMVIIISTVRSNPDYVEDHYKNCLLGFIRNQKRFNVAISRAQALLIIIGNIYCLCSDPSWDRLITYCADNGAIKAESLSSREEAMKYICSH